MHNLAENTKENHAHLLKTLQNLALEDKLMGCFADIPNEVYHHPACPGVSSTTLKSVLSKSLIHLETDRNKKSKAMDLGTGFHLFINEPDVFQNTYQLIPDRGNSFLHPGKQAMTESEFLTIKAMAEKLFKHPDAAPLLVGAQCELTFFSKDKETGLWKKCKVDIFPPGSSSLADLKSTRAVGAEAFMRDCRKLLYRISGAYYLEIVSEVLEKYMRDFYLIACDNQDPYEIQVHRIHDASIAQGEMEVREALRKIKKLQEQGTTAWRGYDLGINDIRI